MCKQFKIGEQTDTSAVNLTKYWDFCSNSVASLIT